MSITMGCRHFLQYRNPQSKFLLHTHTPWFIWQSWQLQGHMAPVGRSHSYILCMMYVMISTVVSLSLTCLPNRPTVQMIQEFQIPITSPRQTLKQELWKIHIGKIDIILIITTIKVGNPRTYSTEPVRLTHAMCTASKVPPS